MHKLIKTFVIAASVAAGFVGIIGLAPAVEAGVAMN